MNTLSTSSRAGIAVTHSLTEIKSGSASDFSSSTLFGNTANDIAIRPGNATLSNFVSSVNGLNVQWGKWVSDSTNPSYLQDVAGNSLGTLTSLIMVSAPITDTATLNKFVGNVSYVSTSSYIADKNSGNTHIEDVTSSLTLNVGTGVVSSGTLNICVAANSCSSTAEPWERWETQFSGASGSLSNGKFTLPLSGAIIVGGTSAAELSGGLNLFTVGSGRTVEGTVTGSFTGTSGEGFVLGFRAVEVGVSTNSIIGANLLKTSPAITQAEIDASTKKSFTLIGPNTNAYNLGINVGTSTDLSANPTILAYSAQSPGFAFRSDSYADGETLSTNIANLEVNWGRWTGTSSVPLKYYPNVQNSGIFNSIDGKVIVASATASPTSALTGSKYFEATSSDSDYISAGTEAATSITGHFNINLNTGALSNGLLEIITSTRHWTSNQFTGQISNGSLPLTNVTGTLTTGESSTQFPFSGKVAGFYVGNSAEGFLTAFDFTKDDSTVHTFGAVLFRLPSPTPALSTSELNTLSTSGRAGIAVSHSLSDVKKGNASNFTSSTLFGNTTDDIAIRTGDAAHSEFVTTVDGLNVQWGKWIGATASPIYWQNVAGDTSGTLDSIILVSAPTTDTATLNKFVGNVSYTGTGTFIADKVSGATAIHDVNSSLTLNVGTGEVSSGTLNICVGTSACSGTSVPWERWETQFSGASGSLSNGKFKLTLAGDIVESNTISTALLGGLNLAAAGSGRVVAGTVTGSFTGTSGEGFVLGFRANEVSNTANSIVGATVLKTPAAITQTEIDSLTNKGFAIVGPNSSASNLGINLGVTPDLNSRADILVYSQNPGFILRTNGVNEDSETRDTSVDDYDLSWARWNGTAGEPLKYQYHLSNGAIFNEIGGSVIFASAVAAPILTSGQKYFEATSYSANITGGSVAANYVKGKFNIDFSSGALTKGKFEVSTSDYSWVTNLFSGQVSNGTLPVINITGNAKDTEIGTQNSFSGTVAGHFIGDNTEGFLAAFDFKRNDASDHSFGAFVLNETTLTPVMSSAEYSSFGDATRYGFILSNDVGGVQAGKRLAIYGNVTVNDGDGNASHTWATEDLVSADLSNLFTVDDTPDYVIDRYEGSILDKDAQESNVTWGRWTDGARVYTNYEDDREYVYTSDESTIFANFIVTDAAQLTYLATNNVKRSYTGTSFTTFGHVDNYLASTYLDDSSTYPDGPIQEFKSVFDVDFNSGAISNGRISLCLISACGNSGSVHWEIGYQGTLNKGLLVNPTTTLAKIDDTSVTLTGTVLGAFHSTNANLYVGGFNFSLASNPGHYVSATYTLAPTDFLTGEAIIGFNDKEYGFLSFSNHIDSGVYGGAAQRKGNSNNFAITDTRLNITNWYNNSAGGASFHNEDLNSFFRKGGAGISITSNTGNLGDLITWGKWAGSTGSEIRRDTYNSTDTNLAVDAYWFIAKPSAPVETSGRWEYSTTLAVQGSGYDGVLAAADIKTFGFVLDLSNGSISAGQFKIQKDNNWEVSFSGSAKDSGTGQGPFLSLSINSVQYNGSYVSTYDSTLAGMLINNGQQAATAFSLKKVGAESSREVAGTLLTARKSKDLDVDWGDWNVPPSFFANTWSNETELLADVDELFTSFNETPEFVIRNLTGTVNYNGSAGVGQGFGGAVGTISSISAHMTVNFDNTSDQISDGHITVNVGASAMEQWHAHFVGSINNGSVILSPDTSQDFTIDTDVNDDGAVGPRISTGTTTFGGTFTGESAAGFIGAFDLIDSERADTFVRGAFQLNQQNDL